MERGSLIRPPKIVRIDDEDTQKLDQLAKANGFGQSGGVTIERLKAGEGASFNSDTLPSQPKLSLKERRPPKETRNSSFNCRMRPSVRDRFDEICLEQGLSQADVLEQLILSYPLKN